MTIFIFYVCTVILLTSLLCGAYRLARGPSLLDQILAFDYICVCILSLITLKSIYLGTDLYLEIILIFSLLGFATVISFMEVFFARLKKNEGD
ncbi:MAG: multisubunit Na+/H+ antiporter MnhF subunit [Chlamydiales bacterium]|jgi:multisubunit Na+/H+ antiporter MnhF subunit